MTLIYTKICINHVNFKKPQLLLPRNIPQLKVIVKVILRIDTIPKGSDFSDENKFYRIIFAL